MVVTLTGAAFFSQWLPSSPKDLINVEEDGILLQLLPSSSWNNPPSEVAKLSNNHVDRIRVLVALEVGDVHAACIRDDEANAGENQYRDLGNRIQIALVSRVNRLIELLRCEMGQYWLERLRVDTKNSSSFFAEHETTATLDGERVRFDPDRRTITVSPRLPSSDARILEDDWTRIRAFVQEEGRVRLTRSLIADARRLAALGNRRNSLADAVTALEVALGDFGRLAGVSVRNRIPPNVETQSLVPLIEKVGLRGFFGVALPLLFSGDEFPQSTLTLCREAIDQRNNVVHRGARDVKERKLWSMIGAIEDACDILERYSVADRPDS